MIVKCDDCGRSYNLQEDQYGKVKCKCGAILQGGTAKAGQAAAAAASAGAGEGAEAKMSDMEAVKHLKSAYDMLRQEISTVIVGQDKVVEEILIAIFARGHCLLEDVPGLAKTLMIATLAKALDLSF